MNGQLTEIAKRWDKVETRLKEIEQISGEARIPAINELRYAGRQIADALLKQITNADGIENHVMVAHQYVRNADHDITDALLDFIKRRLNRALSQYSLATVTSHYPYVPEMKDAISKAEAMIRNSRGDRSKRDAIYDEIYENIIIKLVDRYREYEKIEPSIVYDARLVEAELRVSKGFNKIVGFATLLGLAISVFFWVVPYSAFIGWFK